MAKKMSIIWAVVLLMVVSTGVFAEGEDISAVAEVNGVEISSTDVRREMNMMYQQAVNQGVYPDNSEIEAYWSRSVEVLIGRELLSQDAETKNYHADADAVENYINGLIMNYGGVDALNEALAQQGMTLEKLRTDTARYQVINLFVENELRNKVTLSETAALDYYTENEAYFIEEETVTASHILLKTSEGADEAEVKAVYDKIAKLYDRLENGEDFAELAREYSECPSSENGGELGEFGHGMMVPPFDRAAFALKVGEYSKPVQTQFGYHLILLTDKGGGEVIPFKAVEQQINEYLTNIELESLVDEYVAELKETADIRVF